MSSAEGSADSFLRCVLRSKLLDRTELQAALRDVPREQRDDPVALATHLVRAGKLTRFQTGKLLRGVALGMVIGPFRVLAPLGRGGMGTVFLVRDMRAARLAALKILPPRLARTEARMVARFQREMELCRRVEHPHLVSAYDVGQACGVNYIAMEYIPGRTLSLVVAEDGILPVERAASLFAEVASALHQAHVQGLIHRDLKPSNILVTPRGHAKVVDLGLALIRGEEVRDSAIVGGKGYIVGTMDYIAPEQTQDAAAVGPRCDLYSLGCTLYFALTGQPPFPGGTSKAKIFRHRYEEPQPLAELRPDLPEGFVALVRRLMCKDESGRPADAADAERELRRWGEDASPADESEPEVNLEEALHKGGEPSSEYNLISLPEVEREEDKETGEGSGWVLASLLAGAIVAAMAALAWVLTH